MQQDPVSLGAVNDDEFVARGLFYPSHIDKKGKVNNQVIPKNDVYGGTGSVWRLYPPGRTTDELIPELEASRPNPLRKVVSVKVGRVRQILLNGAGRAFCVVDECDCDQQGGKHPAHAHIAFCKTAISNGVKIEDEIFLQAHRDLMLLFRQTTVWESTQPTNAA